MSHMPFTDSATFDLRQHLADTDIGPADMCNLALDYHADPEAVDALCAHATGSFLLLVGLCAAREYASMYLVVDDELHRDRFHDLVAPGVADQVRAASEADLLEGLHTARAVCTAVPDRTCGPGRCMFRSFSPSMPR